MTRTRTELETMALELLMTDMETIGMTEEECLEEIRKASDEDLRKYIEEVTE